MNYKQIIRMIGGIFLVIALASCQIEALSKKEQELAAEALDKVLKRESPCPGIKPAYDEWVAATINECKAEWIAKSEQPDWNCYKWVCHGLRPEEKLEIEEKSIFESIKVEKTGKAYSIAGQQCTAGTASICPEEYGPDVAYCTPYMQGSYYHTWKQYPCGMSSVCKTNQWGASCIPACTINECREFESRCDGNAVKYCARDENGCLKWTVSMKCGDYGMVCMQNSYGGAISAVCMCAETCQEYQMRCPVEGGVSYKMCQRPQEMTMPGPPSCNSWVDYPCMEGYVCKTSQGTAGCMPDCRVECSEGETKCDGNAVYRCMMQGPCKKWVKEYDCTGGQICKVSQDTTGIKWAACIPNCENMCAYDDIMNWYTRCSPENSMIVQKCSFMPSGCMDWVADYSCMQGQICKDSQSGRARWATCMADGDVYPSAAVPPGGAGSSGRNYCEEGEYTCIPSLAGLPISQMQCLHPYCGEDVNGPCRDLPMCEGYTKPGSGPSAPPHPTDCVSECQKNCSKPLELNEYCKKELEDWKDCVGTDDDIPNSCNNKKTRIYDPCVTKYREEAARLQPEIDNCSNECVNECQADAGIIGPGRSIPPEPGDINLGDNPPLGGEESSAAVCESDGDCNDGKICSMVFGECECPDPECSENECGIKSNQCGKTVTCSNCFGDRVCSLENNQCECPTPACEEDDCGIKENSCGKHVDCRSCKNGMACKNSRCVCEPKTCAELGKQCGVITDNCGSQNDCGDCTGDRMVCSNSICICSDECDAVGREECSGNGKKMCREDADGCKRWETVSCGDGKACNLATLTCERICDNQCKTGDKKCKGTAQIQTCGTDAGCMVWQDSVSCAGGRVCENGECVCPVPICLAGECGGKANECGNTAGCGECENGYSCSQGVCVKKQCPSSDFCNVCCKVDDFNYMSSFITSYLSERLKCPVEFSKMSGYIVNYLMEEPLCAE